jgi:hypothetical protein
MKLKAACFPGCLHACPELSGGICPIWATWHKRIFHPCSNGARVRPSCATSACMSLTIVDDPEINGYLNRLGARLVAQSPDARQDFEFFAH